MLNYLKFFTRSVVFSLLMLSLTWLLFWLAAGAKVFSVQTTSMEPTLNGGDLVIDTKITPSNLKTGEIISYTNTQATSEVVTHRIISINYRQKYLITKGDNLTIADPPVSFDQINGKTFKAISKAGYVFDELHKPLGLMMFVYLPALLISFSEMWFMASKLKGREAYLLI